VIVALVAASNIILGVAYTGYGMMTAIEMKRDWRTFGFSHFGAAWICMAFTCGPHHLDHGLHVAIDGRLGGPARSPGGGGSACRSACCGCGCGSRPSLGGRGDRFIPGDPRWLRAAPAASGPLRGRHRRGLYRGAGGWTAGRAGLRGVGQRHPRRPLHGCRLVRACGRSWATDRRWGGWSVSGLSLSVIFPTCALMHLVWATYAVAGRYPAGRARF